MADRTQDHFQKGKPVKDLRRALSGILPDWQVFVRRRDGRAQQFTVTRGRQMALLAVVAVLAVWAVIATTALTYQPAHLAAKEREMEEIMASTRAAQHRLASAEKLVSNIAREVDEVHANLLTLAESSDSLAKDPPGAKDAKARGGGDAADDDDTQPGAEETRAMREQVRRLQDSLERLRLAYTRAAQQTAETAVSRISRTEQQISRLGLNTSRLVQPRHSPGQGGPFIPVYATGDDRFAMGTLIERMQQWNGMKAAMQRLPLAVPIHGEYELNSGFGSRVDPLNYRSATHEGLDFGAPVGTPVYATGEGVVTMAAPWDRYGNTVEIDHGNGISTRYAHLSRIKVKDGQKVNRSTVIGLVGNTGRSTGAHLHYEVRVADVAKDPIKFISVGRDAPKTH